MRQGVRYQIPCHDCDCRTLAKQNTDFPYPKEEYSADLRFDKSALTKHVFNNQHSMDWTNANNLDFELGFTKRRFIESYFSNQIPNIINEKQNN